VNANEAMKLIREIPNFPKQGILFQDITPLLSNAQAFSAVIDHMAHSSSDFDYVAGMEARGFIFAASIAIQSSRGFIPIRKAGKLPADTHSESYGLEYGDDTLQIHQDACTAPSRILIVDDVLATGGTACAAIRLIEKTGASVNKLIFLLEIESLKGRENILQQFPQMDIESLKKI
jgi:adenine phosphoribosyltransferase